MLTQKNHLDQLKKEIIDKCPLCAGTRLDCSCIQKYNLEVSKIRAAIPQKYRAFQLSDITYPESQSAVKKVGAYLSKLDHYYKKGIGLFLYGGIGTSKTTCSCIVLAEALKKGYSGYFTDLSQCISLLCDSWRDEETKQTFAQQILEVDFLVIDDVGKEYKPPSGFIEAHFDNIFRERANNLLPTIITSNKNLSELGSEFGPRLYSIFHEHLIPIEFKSGDYRRKVLTHYKEK